MSIKLNSLHQDQALVKSQILPPQFEQNNPCKFTTELPQTSANEVPSKLTKIFWGIMGAWGSYNLLDAGLARFLALETLTHGTGPLGYFGISLNGADPNYGGGDTGSSVSIGRVQHVINSKNYFHVFKDSEVNYFSDGTPYPIWHFLSIVMAKMHAVGSGMSNFGSTTSEGLSKTIRSLAGAVAGFFTPTLKFRFKPEEVLHCNYFSRLEQGYNDNPCRFQNDIEYRGLAYRTSRAIPPTYLGVIGSLTQGLDSKTFYRMFNSPIKVAFGVALLATSAAIAQQTYRYIKTEPITNDPTTSNEELSRWEYLKKEAKKIFQPNSAINAAIVALVLNVL